MENSERIVNNAQAYRERTSPSQEKSKHGFFLLGGGSDDVSFSCRRRRRKNSSVKKKQQMGDLVVSLPFEAGTFDALNELFGLVSVGGEGGASKSVARGVVWVAAKLKHWACSS